MASTQDLMTMKNLTAKVNQVFSFTNEELESIDFLPIDTQHFHVILNNKSYQATLIEANYQDKSFQINVNGSPYTIQLSDQYDQLIEQLGLDVIAKQAVLDIIAPMPGLVLDIMVKKGQIIEEGTPILILEAMKMENVLKAAAPGLIGSIEVKKGNAVEKGQLLVKIGNEEE